MHRRLLRLGRCAVHPVVRRDVGLLVVLAGCQVVQRELADRRLKGIEGDLDGTAVAQGEPRRPGVQRDDHHNRRNGDGQGQAQPFRLAAQGDVGEVLARMHHQHEEHVEDNEDGEGQHAQEMDAPRDLATAQQPDVPGEAGRDGRRHRGTGHQHDRREHKDHNGVGELLQGVIGLELAQRRHLQTEIGRQGMPGAGKDIPGRGDQPSPLARPEQQHDIDEPGQQPQRVGDAVPVPPDSEVLVAGHPKPGRDVDLVLARGVEDVGTGRHLLFGELQPFRARGAAVVPVQPGVRHQDLDAAAHQEHHEQQVQVVAETQPPRESQRLRRDDRLRCSHGRLLPHVSAPRAAATSRRS